MQFLRKPPLNAMVAFEAAARLGSFTLAAAELNVTHGAISHQIKHLEHHLGLTLFDRHVRRIELTSTGAEYLAEIAPALRQIAAASAHLTRKIRTDQVRINVRSSFAVRWLIPRLPDFVREHHGIEPKVITSAVAPDMEAGFFDVAIRRSDTRWAAGMVSEPFLSDYALAVVSPALARGKPIHSIQDLGGHTLLHTRTLPEDWPIWFARWAGMNYVSGNSLEFDHHHLVIQAAIDGLGVALCPISFVGAELASGRLVAPLPNARTMLAPLRYAIRKTPTAASMAFATWLRRIGQAEDAKMPTSINDARALDAVFGIASE